MKMKKILLVALSLMLLLAFGCSHDTNNSSVTNPNPNPYTPKGSVSGVLQDRETKAPIVGAVVSIYDQKATTDSTGMFTIYNVPANSAVDSLDSKDVLADSQGYDYYNVVIDLSNVNAKINAADATAPVYPAIAYDKVTIKYTSLGESAGGSTNSTNHDTPVDGFVANINPTIGKLDTSIMVQVVNCKDDTPVAGVTVGLHLRDYSNNSTSGNPGNLVQSGTTDANGYYTFTGVEALNDFFVVALSTDGALIGQLGVSSFGKGDVSTYTSTVNGPVIVCSTDNVAPYVVSTSPAYGADIALNSDNSITVTFNFSEAILGAGASATADNYAGRLTAAQSVINGIYDDISVKYEGSKYYDRGTEIPHTLAWTDTKTLVVTIPGAVAASRYEVKLSSHNKLTDLAGNRLVSDIYADDDMHSIRVLFTTAGSPVITAPVISDANWFTTIEWITVDGALGYKVYVQHFTANGTLLGMKAYTQGGNTSFDMTTMSGAMSTTTGFDNGAYYEVFVVGLSGGEGIEGPVSNTLKIEDNVVAGPVVTQINPPDGGLYTWPAIPNAMFYKWQAFKVTGGIMNPVPDASGYSDPAVGGLPGSAAQYNAQFDGWFNNHSSAWHVGENATYYLFQVMAVLDNHQNTKWSAFVMRSDPTLPAITSLDRYPLFIPNILTDTEWEAGDVLYSGINGGSASTADEESLAASAADKGAVDPVTGKVLFSTAGESRTLVVTVNFAKGHLMNKASVETLANWTVRVATAADPCGAFGVTGDKVVHPVITNVRFDEVNNRAVIDFTYTQNATKDALYDFGHEVFSFSGIDVEGIAIDPDLNEIVPNWYYDATPF